MYKAMKDLYEDDMRSQKQYIDRLKADKAELVEALEHIAEYWNRDRNDGAMHDALWHIINEADELIEKHKEG